MPPQKVALEAAWNNDAEEILAQDDSNYTKEFMQRMKQQMIDLAAKNVATNPKLEALSTH